MKIGLKREVDRTLEAEVRLTIDDHYARVRNDGGIHLCSGGGRLYIMPEEVEEFTSLLVSLLMELKK